MASMLSILSAIDGIDSIDMYAIRLLTEGTNPRIEMNTMAGGVFFPHLGGVFLLDTAGYNQGTDRKNAVNYTSSGASSRFTCTCKNGSHGNSLTT